MGRKLATRSWGILPGGNPCTQVHAPLLVYAARGGSSLPLARGLTTPRQSTRLRPCPVGPLTAPPSFPIPSVLPPALRRCLLFHECLRFGYVSRSSMPSPSVSAARTLVWRSLRRGGTKVLLSPGQAALPLSAVKIIPATSRFADVALYCVLRSLSQTTGADGRRWYTSRCSAGVKCSPWYGLPS